jgi:hypothetical protein
MQINPIGSQEAKEGSGQPRKEDQKGEEREGRAEVS